MFFLTLWVIFSFCCCPKALILMMFNLFMFSFLAYAFGAISKKTLPNTKPWILILVSSFTRFIVRFSSTRFPAFIFMFLILLDLIFVYGRRVGTQPYLMWICHCYISFSKRKKKGKKKFKKNPIYSCHIQRFSVGPFVNSVGYILLKYNSAIKTFHRCTYN